MSTRKWFDPIEEPWMRRSRRKSKPCSSIFCPNGIMPTMVAVPPGASIANACSAVSLRPSTSKAMYATFGEFAHLLHDIAVPGIDDVGRSELGRKLQFRGIGIDREDAAGAGNFGSVCRRHAH